MIGDVAKGVMDYNGGERLLAQNKADIMKYVDSFKPEAPYRLCLVRMKDGPLTMFEANRRGLATYIHYFILQKTPFTHLDPLVAEVEEKLPIQSE
jgi:hypothetical protein